MKYVTMLMLVALFGFADEPRPGDIFNESCAPNEAQATERDRTITKVCFSEVEGAVDLKLVVVYFEDKTGRALVPEVMHVIEEGKLKVTSTDKNTGRMLGSDSWLLGTHKTLLRGKQLVYLTRTLNRKLNIIPIPGPEGRNFTTYQRFPFEVTGQDSTGIPFKLTKFEFNSRVKKAKVGATGQPVEGEIFK